MINIVTALTCEANPIIQRYALRKYPKTAAFPIYENDSMNLIISGMGKFASACAVGYLQSLSQSIAENSMYAGVPHIWLNVGIAGHRTLGLGTVLLAHKISDSVEEYTFYPCFTFEAPCATAEIITVDKAETQFPEDAAYDMEAVGFCAAATRFSSAELIHCLKIVSDNESVSQERITKHVGEELVANQLPVIDALVQEFYMIQAIANTMFSLPDDYRLLTQKYRFTVTQQNQLKRLLLRWRTLKSTCLSEEMAMGDFKNAKQLLMAIESELQPILFMC